MGIPTSDVEGAPCTATSGKAVGCLYAGEQSEWLCISGAKKQCAKGHLCVNTKDPATGTIVGEGCDFPPHPDVEHPEVGKKYRAGTKVKVGTTIGNGTVPVTNYCQIPLPTAELAAGSTSCIRGSQMASSYTSSGTDSACADHIKFTPGTKYAAAYHYSSEPHLSNAFNTNLCGKTLDVTNKKTGRTLTVTVVDNCPSCTGIAPAYESEWASINGATIDLDEYTFAALFDGATTGVFDVEYTPFEGDLTRQVAISKAMD
ncbi:hypothetical protein QFC22_003347 [Naganishia vaughanmartiniae]|uniref:Uncharacterized protein n=1 Tax=Naganishia vaughanmartiniae TaxID=1424756 RepID=A0ACC2X770_9TREE|nr:hypothetical protein QFC22_003347 [Naganishia vaughanmartiniae]